MPNPTDLLRRAATKLRDTANAALRDPEERWMVDQSPDNGLIIGSYTPGDINPDGSVSTGCVAFFAYPDDEDGKAYAGALEVASYMALLQPAVALPLADLLDDLAASGFRFEAGAHAIRLSREILREES